MAGHMPLEHGIGVRVPARQKRNEVMFWRVGARRECPKRLSTDRQAFPGIFHKKIESLLGSHEKCISAIK